jgi:short-subunit dehydrogenase
VARPAQGGGLRPHQSGADLACLNRLYFDLTPKNIKIQVICPGFIDTEATAVNDFDMPGLMSAETAAQHIITEMKSDIFSVSFPKSFTRKMKFLKYLPDRLYFSLVGKQTGAM